VPLLIACLLLTSAYALLMLVYRFGWMRQPVFSADKDFLPGTGISVVIPARNEAGNIAACIRSILAQDYPAALLEIIVVDDHSDDDTLLVARAAGEGVKVISLKDRLAGDKVVVNAFKKHALAAGIAAATGKLIVTTDADCLAPPRWLANMAACYEHTGAAMIIAPVKFTVSPRLVELFQAMDFTTMQGITAAAHRLGLGSMANGANLAFSREAFHAVGGYSGIDHLASGDDYLLLHKMQQRFPAQIHYLKCREAVIRTAPQPDWRSFLQQRIRWASKSGKYADYRLTGILLLVYLFNAAIAALAAACFWQPDVWAVVAAMLIVKTAAELVFLVPVWRFFNNGRGLWLFPLLQPLHIAYIVLAGFLGLLGGYRWKGRAVR
jgi:cellulose synthase/poly-beta-1,6-N-acetylglucosamine synthase-like glycosyltransferase